MQIVQYSKNGMSQRAIQKVVGCSVQTVNRTVQRYRDYGTVRDMRREHRPRMTTEEEDRLIIAAVVDEPFLTAADIRRELGLGCSENTIRLRLREAGLTCFTSNPRRALTPSLREVRLAFAAEHAGWSADQWRSVVFTNECTMSLKWDPNREAWKAMHSWNDPVSVRQLVASGHTSINLYAALTCAGLGPLVRVTGSATAEACVDIIDTVLVPFLLDGPFREGDFLLQQDCSPVYSSDAVRAHLEGLGISEMPWPPKSEDLSPIKSVWEVVKRRICRKRVPESSPDLLWALVQKEWDVLSRTPDFVRGFYTSLPNSMANVIRLKGAAI